MAGQGRVRNPEADRRFKNHIQGEVDNTIGDDPRGVFEFLRDNPAFVDKPATIEEFLGKDYLNVERSIRPGVRAALVDIFGTEVYPDQISEKREGMFTGGIGCGKTTLASIAIPYMVHWVLCLHDPNDYFGFMQGTRIAFMLMSTTDAQAKEVLFGDIKARMLASPWFKKLETPWKDKSPYPWDPAYKNQLRFPKDINVLPGNSQETTFEGYNILGGIIDEGDSHKVTDKKDYAENGWNTIVNRIASRFTPPGTEEHMGLILAIGQMKSATGFMARKMKKLQASIAQDEREGRVPRASVTRLSYWESFGWQRYKKNGKYQVFWFDIDRKAVVSAQMARDIKADNIIPIPLVFFKNFDDNPVKALKDLAGIPPAATDPFIAVMERVNSAMTRWHEHHPDIDQPVSDSCTSPQFHPNFFADGSLRRVVHMDIAYSDAETADALGMAMGHVSHLITMDGDIKPYIVFDFLMRIKAQTGQQIMLADVRRIIYHLRDDLGFKISQTTCDGTNSVDMIQTLQRRRIPSTYLSVDKNKQPYEDLRECIYERRCEFPAYYTQLNPGGEEYSVIPYQELSQLNDDGKKIDHPVGGSKDVADAMAAVCHVLTGSGTYRRGLRKLAADGTEDLASGVTMEYGMGYDPSFNKAFEPIDAEFTVEGELQAVMGMGPLIPKSNPYGFPELERFPFGEKGRPPNY